MKLELVKGIQKLFKNIAKNTIGRKKIDAVSEGDGFSVSSFFRKTR